MRFLILFLLILAPLQALVLEDVRVSVTAESSLKAREQALDSAYLKAFEQLQEHMPEVSISPTQFQNMVRSMRVNREKVTGNSYMASYTFDIDEGALAQTSLAQTSLAQPSLPQATTAPLASAAPLPFQGPGTPITLQVQYKDLKEWAALETLLRASSRDLTLSSLSIHEALLTLTPAVDETTLQQKLQSAGWHKTPQDSTGNNGTTWLLSRL